MDAVTNSNRKFGIIILVFLLIGVSCMEKVHAVDAYEGSWKFKRYAYGEIGGFLSNEIGQWKSFEVNISHNIIRFESCGHITSCIDPAQDLIIPGTYSCKYNLVKVNNWGYKDAFEYFKIGFKVNPFEITQKQVNKFVVIATDCDAKLFSEIVFINDDLMVLYAGGGFVVMEREI